MFLVYFDALTSEIYKIYKIANFESLIKDIFLNEIHVFDKLFYIIELTNRSPLKHIIIALNIFSTVILVFAAIPSVVINGVSVTRVLQDRRLFRWGFRYLGLHSHIYQ